MLRGHGFATEPGVFATEPNVSPALPDSMLLAQQSFPFGTYAVPAPLPSANSVMLPEASARRGRASPPRLLGRVLDRPEQFCNRREQASPPRASPPRPPRVAPRDWVFTTPPRTAEQTRAMERRRMVFGTFAPGQWERLTDAERIAFLARTPERQRSPVPPLQVPPMRVTVYGVEDVEAHNDGEVCVAFLHNNPNIILTPCGHAVTCASCTRSMLRLNPCMTCPVCRSEVTNLTIR